jgi:hypothetical protein
MSVIDNFHSSFLGKKCNSLLFQRHPCLVWPGLPLNLTCTLLHLLQLFSLAKSYTDLSYSPLQISRTFSAALAFPKYVSNSRTLCNWSCLDNSPQPVPNLVRNHKHRQQIYSVLQIIQVGCVQWVTRKAIRFYVDHAPTCSAVVKNVWSCTSAPPICLRGFGRDNSTMIIIIIIIITLPPTSYCMIVNPWSNIKEWRWGLKLRTKCTWHCITRSVSTCVTVCAAVTGTSFGSPTLQRLPVMSCEVVLRGNTCWHLWLLVSLSLSHSSWAVLAGTIIIIIMTLSVVVITQAIW